ncbi:MAG: hypothetical protein LQ340_005535, partial [Diploschistes diacapsis]
MTFKRRRGLYFWSLFVSIWGVFFHELGFLLKLWQLTTNNYLSCTIITIGWWPMVTGQALVLYSRLHLVVKEQWILKGVLYMILWNAVTLHPSTTILTYGSGVTDSTAFLHGFNVMEPLQMTIFSLQELIISGIYLWATRRLLRPIYRGKTRSVMMQLIWVNLVIILMDAALLAEEYQGVYELEAPMKGVVYSIKLKLEFAVLTQLMRLAHTGIDPAKLRYDEEQAWGKKQKTNPLGRLRRILPPKRSVVPDVEHSTIETQLSGPSIEVPSGFHALEPQLSHNVPSKRSFSITGFGNIPDDPRTLESVLNSAAAATEERERNGSVSNVYNNPAAFFPSGRRRRPRDPLDPLFTIESPESSRQASVRQTQTQFSTIDYNATRSTRNSDSLTPSEDDDAAPNSPGGRLSPSPSPPQSHSFPSPLDLASLPPLPPPTYQGPSRPTSSAEPEPQYPQIRPNTICATTAQPLDTSSPQPRPRTDITRSASTRSSFPNRFSTLFNPHARSTSDPASRAAAAHPSLSPSPSTVPMEPDPQLLRASRPSVADWLPSPMAEEDDDEEDTDADADMMEVAEIGASSP